MPTTQNDKATDKSSTHNMLHVARETAEAAGAFSALGQGPVAHAVHTAAKVVEPVTAAYSFSDYYDDNRKQGNSVLSSLAGATAGTTVKHGVQAAAVAEGKVAVDLAATGVGIPASIPVAAAATATFMQADGAGRAASTATARVMNELGKSTEIYHPPTSMIAETFVFKPKSEAPPAASSPAAKEAAAAINAKVNDCAQTKENVAATFNAASQKTSSTKEVSLSVEDEQTFEFLLSYGTKPEVVDALYHQDPDSWKEAKNALSQLKEYESALAKQQDQAQCIAFFQGVGTVFNTLAASGNQELAHIGKVGAPIMQGLVAVETLWGVFSGGAGSLSTLGLFGSMGAIGGLIGAGIGLLNVLMGSDDEEQQQRLMEEFNALHQHIDMFRREMHERFDHVDNAIANLSNMLSSYCRQILKNQDTLFKQNKAHIELSLQGFRTVSHMLAELRQENKTLHQRTFNKVSYLASAKENEELQTLKEKGKEKINLIRSHAKHYPGATLDDAQGDYYMLKQFNKLVSVLENSVSLDRNGATKCADCKNDPLESSQFLIKRDQMKDDSLGFLASEMERITGKHLIDAGIHKDMLPTTGVWFQLVEQLIYLSRLPQFATLDSSDLFQSIKAQTDNLEKFIQEIQKNDLIPILLKRHQENLEAIQQLVYQRFTIERATVQGKEQKLNVSMDKKLNVGDYLTDLAAHPLMQQLDYNYLLLNCFAQLGGVNPDLQQHIAKLDQSSDLLKQPFNFNEAPVILTDDNKNGPTFYDSAMADNHRFTLRHEYSEEVAAHLYGNPGSEKMAFMRCLSWSGGPYASLNVAHFDPAIGKVTSGEKYLTTQTNDAAPFQYKGAEKTLPHVWASSHVVTMNNKPYLALFTGGSGYGALYDIEAEKWLTCDNNNRPEFAVPLEINRRHLGMFTNKKAPNTTSYTQILRDRYLLVEKLVWPEKYEFETKPVAQKTDKSKIYLNLAKSPILEYEVLGQYGILHKGSIDFTSDLQTIYSFLPNPFAINQLESILNRLGMKEKIHQTMADRGHLPQGPEIHFDAFDLQKRRWLSSGWEVHNLFNDSSYIAYIEPPLRYHKKISPNQFFINKISPVGKNEAMVYGIVQPNGKNIATSIYYKRIDAEGVFKPGVEKKEAVHGNYSFPIATQTIHQTRSEMLKIGNENELITVSSITSEDGKQKLVIISHDFFGNKHEAKAIDIPQLHPNSDWQAMRTAVATIGGKQHLIISALDPEFRMLLFSYDPATKELTRLPDGPQLDFLKFDDRNDSHLRELQDDHLMRTREEDPGFYPVRSIDMRVGKENGMNKIFVTHPNPVAHNKMFHLRVTSIPLAPILETKPTINTLSLTPTAEQKSTPTRLSLGILKTKLLLSLPKFSSTIKPKTQDSKQESSFSAITATCKKIQKLFSVAIKGISSETKDLVSDEINSMNTLLAESSLTASQIQELFKIMVMIDGILKTTEQSYQSGIGGNINLLIGELKKDIDQLREAVSKPAPSVHRTNLFAHDDGKKLADIISKNMDILQQIKPINTSLVTELTNEAKKWGLTSKDMPRDGNCFFHAVVDQLKLHTANSTETYVTLREKAIAHILSKPEKYKNFIVGDFNKFINENMENRTWADAVMITALAETLNVTLVLVRSDHDKPNIIKQPDAKAVLYLGYEVGYHYQSLQGVSPTLKAEVDATKTETLPNAKITAKK